MNMPLSFLSWVQPDILQFQKFNSGSIQHNPVKELHHQHQQHQHYSTPSPPHTTHTGSPVAGTSSPNRLAPIDLPSTTSSTLSTIVSAASSAPVCATPPESAESKEDVGEATYVSSKCIIIKYFKTDVASALDDHFQKALAQAGFGGPSRRNDEDSTGE